MRFDIISVNGSVFEDFDYLIGKYDDKNGSSLKFFFNENGNAEKVVYFDDECVANQKFDFNSSLINGIDLQNIQSINESKIKSIIDNLLQASNKN